MPLGTLKTNITTKDIWVWHNSVMDDLEAFCLMVEWELMFGELTDVWFECI